MKIKKETRVHIHTHEQASEKEGGEEIIHDFKKSKTDFSSKVSVL